MKLKNETKLLIQKWKYFLNSSTRDTPTYLPLSPTRFSSRSSSSSEIVVLNRYFYGRIYIWIRILYICNLLYWIVSSFFSVLLVGNLLGDCFSVRFRLSWTDTYRLLELIYDYKINVITIKPFSNIFCAFLEKAVSFWTNNLTLQTRFLDALFFLSLYLYSVSVCFFNFKFYFSPVKDAFCQYFLWYFLTMKQVSTLKELEKNILQSHASYFTLNWNMTLIIYIYKIRLFN